MFLDWNAKADLDSCVTLAGTLASGMAVLHDAFAYDQGPGNAYLLSLFLFGELADKLKSDLSNLVDSGSAE
jgi:hypothetical protein